MGVVLQLHDFVRLKPSPPIRLARTMNKEEK